MFIVWRASFLRIHQTRSDKTFREKLTYSFLFWNRPTGTFVYFEQLEECRTSSDWTKQSFMPYLTYIYSSLQLMSLHVLRYLVGVVRCEGVEQWVWIEAARFGYLSS